MKQQLQMSRGVRKEIDALWEMGLEPYEIDYLISERFKEGISYNRR